MIQLVILSGKGGTGKTSVAAALAHLAAEDLGSERIVLADADVDASNLGLILQPRLVESEPFDGPKVAQIDAETCTQCGLCAEICRFDAIAAPEGAYRVDPVACDGCAACVHQCPAGCIAMHEQVAGTFFRSESRYGPLYHADLLPGQENSGKLVTLVRERARQRALDDRRDLVIVDGPPGIGCPVISAVSGADLALIVAEPTVSGVHDMQRALDTVRHFNVPAFVVVNKADIYPDGARRIGEFCRDNELDAIGHIPFDLTIARAMVGGEPVTKFAPRSPAGTAVRDVWRRVRSVVTNDSTTSQQGE